MAHAIDQTTGRAAVFVTGEPAWHQLGMVIENATTSAEAIGLAGLDWRVEQWPVRAFDPDNHADREAGIPDTVANVRTDTKAVLGVVGNAIGCFRTMKLSTSWTDWLGTSWRCTRRRAVCTGASGFG